MKVLDILNKNNWIQIHTAENEYGEIVPFDSLDACKWCLLGAILLCYREKSMKIIEKFHNDNNGLSIVSWNDAYTRTWEEVEVLIKKLDL